jgi:lysophospholipase L1-like esterase
MQHPETWRVNRLSSDGLHPNTLGYQTLLQDVTNWEAIARFDCGDRSRLTS